MILMVLMFLMVLKDAYDAYDRTTQTTQTTQTTMGKTTVVFERKSSIADSWRRTYRRGLSEGKADTTATTTRTEKDVLTIDTVNHVYEGSWGWGYERNLEDF